MKNLICCLNDIHNNIWALLIIGVGAVLTCCGQKETGTVLITLGAAVFQRESKPELKDENRVV